MMKGVHPVLQPVIMRATRYRREDRHQSMRELAKELYHAKSQLEEDPPDTPSLIMNDVQSYDDELGRMTSSEITAETPFSELQVQMTPPSGETVVPSLAGDWVGTPPATTPGIPRMSLLREEQGPLSLQGAAPGYLLRAIALGLVPVVLLALLLFGVAMRGRAQVHKQVELVEAQHGKLEQTLTSEQAVVSELASLGASELDLQSHWSGWQSVTGPERELKVDQMLLTFRRELKENKPEAGSSRVHISRKATARVERMDEELAKTQAASRKLADAADSVPGRLAIGFGLASDSY